MANRLRFLLSLVLLVATAAFADPPARVGRISHVQGDVSFRAEDREASTAAVVNWPVTTGNVVATAPYSRGEVRIGSTAIRLDGATELEFAALDDERIALRLVSGSIALRVRSREHAAELEVLTPHGRALLADTGRYRLDVDPHRGTTLLVVHEGAARFEGPGVALAAGAGQQAEIRGGQAADARVTAAFRDEFDDWSLARDRRDDASRSARYVSPETTGYDELDAHGDWRESPEYGAVWYPRAVPAGWVPYRDGRWAWIEPWGWTWVDYAPWGFAPFHYGRWALIGGLWAWVPGRIVARPVYAPALVAWVGRPGFSITVSIGSVPAVGWFPLAPREVFYPGYRCSETYVRNINVTHVTRIVEVHREPPAHVRHANRPHALTVVPTRAVSSGQSVRAAAVHPTDRAALAALPVASSAPEVARPPGRERRAQEAARGREGLPVGVPAPAKAGAAAPDRPIAGERPAQGRPVTSDGAGRAATAPAAAPPRTAPPQAPAARDRRGDPTDRRASPESERRDRIDAPAAGVPDSRFKRETPTASPQLPAPRTDRRDNAAQVEPPVQQPRPEQRGVPPGESRQPQVETRGAQVERREPARQPDRPQLQPLPSEPRAVPQSRTDPSPARADVPQPRAERQPVPQPRSEPRAVPQPRVDPAPTPRAERQPVPQPRIDPPPAPRVERQPAPQPRPEARATAPPRVEPAPAPRVERQPAPQPRPESRAMGQPRAEPQPPRAAQPSTEAPRQRREGEKRRPPEGGN